MTEKPILFNTEMVKAILDGRKTQTRRIMKLRDGSLADDDDISCDGITVMDFSKTYPRWQELFCPYGRPGDSLWVRETWAVSPFLNKTKPSNLEGCIKGKNPSVIYKASNEYGNTKDYTWRPSIFMPRWASRLTLQITDVRVERLQDISTNDAIAEGLHCPDTTTFSDCYGIWTGEKFVSNVDPRNTFMFLWDSINAKRGYGWQKNPWVWVVEFRRV